MQTLTRVVAVCYLNSAHSSLLMCIDAALAHTVGVTAGRCTLICTCSCLQQAALFEKQLSVSVSSATVAALSTDAFHVHCALRCDHSSSLI
jgi:hypothetical protein